MAGKNPLVTLAKKIPKEIDIFAVGYDEAVDKNDYMMGISDLMSLKKNNSPSYASMCYALGIHQGIIEEAESHIRLYHSYQNGVNRMGDNKRIDNIIEFLTFKFIDVS